MHEMALAENVIEIVANAAGRGGALRVNTIRLEIGELSCVGTDALRFCFDAVARGTVAEHARLEIIRVPGEGTCDGCARHSPMTALYDTCPHCETGTMQPQRGTEMRVKEIEVD